MGFVIFRAPNNPPARGNGKPCSEDELVEVRECGDETCKHCMIKGVQYAVSEITSYEACTKKWSVIGSHTQLTLYCIRRSKLELPQHVNSNQKDFIEQLQNTINSTAKSTLCTECPTLYCVNIAS